MIYYVEEKRTYVAKMDAIIAAIEDSPIEAVSSVITLTEVLTHPLKVGNARLVHEYRNILLNSRRFRLLPITSQIAESAADLRARYNLRTPDALHVAAGIDARCDAFLTNDAGIKRVTEITVLVLAELELDSAEA
ncbi:MAG TPA: PIN domain-containing protein [Candidatus Tectomicrobia bacterium]